MSLGALLTLPWYGLRRSLRWLCVLMTLAVWLTAAAVADFVRPAWPDGWLSAAAVLAVWLALMGFALGSLLLPAHEARQLRLPHVERAAVLSLGLNGSVLLALTATALALLSGHPLPVVQILLMGLVAGFAYALVPALWMIAVFVSIPLLQVLAHLWRWRLIGPLDPRFLEVCAGFVALAIAVSAWSWRAVLRRAHGELGWGMRPVVLNLRLRAALGTGASTDAQMRAARQTPLWLRPRVDIREAGPRDIPRSLRLLLGGPYLPVSLRSLTRPLVLSVLPLMLVGLGYFPTLVQHGWRGPEARSLGAQAVMFASWVLLIAGASVRSLHLVGRWGRPDGELAVLPLLPGLGAGGEQAGWLLRMLFRQMRNWSVPPILAALLVEWMGGQGRDSAAMLLMVLALIPATEIAVIYCVLGRCRLPPWALWPFAVVGSVTLIVGFNVAIQPRGAAPGVLLHGLLAASALCYAVLIWLAGRGRRGLRRRPHPYLGLN